MKYEIHSYKHNGRIHRRWEDVILIEETDDYIVLGVTNPVITERNGNKRNPKEDNVIVFFKNSWYNVIARFRKDGLFYKVDIGSPFILEDNVVKFIDYDLDLKVFPNGSFRVLDKNEYKFHKRIMKYSDDLDIVLKHQLSEVINLKKNNESLFNKTILNNYYNKYLNIVNSM